MRRLTEGENARCAAAPAHARFLAVALSAALAACAAALVLGGCGTAAAGGGTQASSSPPAAATSSSAGAAAGSRPLPGSVEQAAAAYWRLIDAGDYAAIAAAGVPGRPPSATAATDDIAAAHLVTVDSVGEQSADDGTVLAQVQVFIEPDAAGGQPTPWGDSGDHTLFMYLREAPEGGWLVQSWGTGP